MGYVKPDLKYSSSCSLPGDPFMSQEESLKSAASNASLVRQQRIHSAMQDDGSCLWTLEQGKLDYPQENIQLLQVLQAAP